MPTIPIEQYKVGLPQQQIPRSSARDFGGAAYEGLTDMAESLSAVGQAQRQQQDALDFALKASDYDAKVDAYAEEVKAEPDFQKREALFQSGMMKIQEQTAKEAGTPSVRNALALHQAKTLPKRVLDFRKQNQSDWNSQKLADLDNLENVLSDRAVAAKTPEEAEQMRRTYRGLLAGMSTGPYAAMTAEQAEKRAQRFETTSLVKAANVQIRNDPERFIQEIVGTQGEGLDNFPGLVEKGNIDIMNRPRVKNADGSISTVRSMSINVDGKEVLIPTVSEDGKILSDDAAVKQYEKTGKHLGIFENEKAATKYARALHDQQAGMVSGDRWAGLDLDTRVKLGEQARAKIAQRDVQRDKLARDTKKMEMDQANAQANFGQLDPIRLDKALRGEDPYITPSEARHLKEVNEKPPTGEGNTAIGAIESAYKLKPRSLATISRAFAELNNLQRQLGAPNPAITKFANELQSDQTALETQGIARQANDIAAQNRGISNLKNEYDASKPQMPKALEGIMGNHDAQNKAKIESEYRKNGPEAAKKMADSLAKGQKAKTDAMPEKRKEIQGLVR